MKTYAISFTIDDDNFDSVNFVDEFESDEAAVTWAKSNCLVYETYSVFRCELINVGGDV